MAVRLYPSVRVGPRPSTCRLRAGDHGDKHGRSVRATAAILLPRSDRRDRTATRGREPIVRSSSPLAAESRRSTDRVDDTPSLELRPDYGSTIVTANTRIGGRRRARNRASPPAYQTGAIGPDAAERVAEVVPTSFNVSLLTMRRRFRTENRPLGSTATKTSRHPCRMGAQTSLRPSAAVFRPVSLASSEWVGSYEHLLEVRIILRLA